MPTLTNILRTILQGDARSYVQATQQAGNATDRFIASYQRAQRSVSRELSFRRSLGNDAFEQGLEAFKATEAALTRQKQLRRDLMQTQAGLTRAEVVATGASIAFDAALGKVIETGAARQSTRLTFENQFGRGTGTDMFRQVGDLARRSPFSADALREGALSLREMGEDARLIVPDLQALGNAAAFTGRGDEGIRRLSGALGQARQEHAAAPLIGAMEAEGLRPFDILQRKLGLNRMAAQALGNDFASSDRLLRALMEGMREAGGGHAMEDRMGTAAASVEKFHDALKDLQDEIGTGLLPQFTGLTQKATDWIRTLPPEVKGVAGTGLVVGGGLANLAASVGIPAATAWNTWKIAQMAKGGGGAARVAAAGEGAAAGEAAAAGTAGEVAAGTGAGILPLLASRLVPAIAAIMIGWEFGTALGHQLFQRRERVNVNRLDPRVTQDIGQAQATASPESAAHVPTQIELEHLRELQRQTDLLEQQNALLGRATLPGQQGVVPFSEVPFRRQMAFQNIHRKGG